MKVYFKTNLDWYNTVGWPVLDVVPPIGAAVHVIPASEPFCKANKIPTMLAVVAHNFHYDRVEVELWYRPVEVECAKLNGRLSHLYKQD